MPTTVCPDCKTRPVASGRYLCRECEDRMSGRPSNASGSDQGGSRNSALLCTRCGMALGSGDLFCASCGSPRPSGAAGRPSSARAPREDSTYQDPVNVGGVYHCPKCNAVLEAGTKRCSTCGVLFIHPIPQAPRSTPSGAAPPPAVCPDCGTSWTEGDQFCSGCGEARRQTAAGASTDGPFSGFQGAPPGFQGSQGTHAESDAYGSHGAPNPHGPSATESSATGTASTPQYAWQTPPKSP